jgi:hypothetical protein
MADEMQKITVEVPVKTLNAAKSYTKMGTSATIREALDRLARLEAQNEFLKLEGTLKRGVISIEEMRSWEEDDPVFKVWEDFHNNKKS